MQRKSRVSVDPVLAIGTVLSIGLATVFYFYDDLALTIAFFAGMLGIIITLQVQESTKERRRAEHESRLGAIIATLEQSVWLPDVIESMLRSTTVVERTYPGTPAVETARELMEQCRTRMADLESGRFHHPYVENALNLRLCQALRREFLAISVPALDLAWWRTPEGRQYWSLQVQALDRGATIRRVFVHNGWTDDIDAMAREQKSAGVEVRSVHRDELPVGIRGIVGIWDGTCGVEVKYDASGEAISWAYSVSPSDLDRLRRQFEQVERMAVSLEEPEPTAGVAGSSQHH